MRAKSLVIAGLVTSLQGCSLFCPEPEVEVVVTDSSCLAFSAIRLTKAEVEMLSDESVQQLLQHNRVGQLRCGW